VGFEGGSAVGLGIIATEHYGISIPQRRFMD